MSQSAPEDNVPVAAEVSVEEVVAPEVVEEASVAVEEAPVVVVEATAVAAEPSSDAPVRRRKK